MALNANEQCVVFVAIMSNEMYQRASGEAQFHCSADKLRLTF